MDLEMDLWEEALAAKGRVEDIEAEVERARSSFHELVRQLNTSGASLREIASRVQLSHQRVHQIVEGVACGFCDRRRAECERMVAGPGVFICDSCTSLGLHALAEGWGASDERTRLEVRSDEERCCFCRKRASRVGPLATRGTMRICGHCLTLATREFDRSATPTVGKRSERRGRRKGIRDLTPRAEKALAEAGSFARSMGHEVVADHHLLLGLMAVEEGVAATVLTRVGVTMSSLQDAVLAIAPAQSTTVENPIGMSPGTKRMIEAAASHATRLGSQRVGTEHLLMALADQSVPVRELLIGLGVDPDLVPTTIEELLSG
jgi:hypothetical protein